MKIRILLLMTSLFFLSNARGQSPMDSIAMAACNCLDKLDLESFSGNDLELQLGLCIVQAISEKEDLLYRAMGEDFILDATTGEKLGQQIGFKMVTVCPDIFSALMVEEL